MVDPTSFARVQAPGGMENFAGNVVRAHQAGVSTGIMQNKNRLMMEADERQKTAEQRAKGAYDAWRNGNKDAFRAYVGDLATLDPKAAKDLVATYGALDRTNFVSAAFHVNNALLFDGTDQEASDSALIQAVDALNVVPEHPYAKNLKKIIAMQPGKEKTHALLQAYNFARLSGAYGDPEKMGQQNLDWEKLRVQQGNLQMRVAEYYQDVKKENAMEAHRKWTEKYGDEPPPGFYWDKDTKELKVTPNGPEYVRRSEEKRKRMEMFDNNITKGERLLGQIEKALSQANWRTTGPLGFVLKFIPGTDAYDLKAMADTVRANIGFDALQKMRLQSPTGGALGQVAVKELDFLQASLANLDQAQGIDQFKANMKIVMVHYKKFLQAAREEMKRAEDVSIDKFHGSGPMGAEVSKTSEMQFNDDTPTEDLLNVF